MSDTIAPKRVKGLQPPVPSQVLMMLEEALDGDRHGALNLMRRIPGVVLRIPTQDAIERLISGLQMAKTLQRDPSQRSVTHVADFHDAPRRAVALAFCKHANAAGLTAERRQRGMACRNPRVNRARFRFAV